LPEVVLDEELDASSSGEEKDSPAGTDPPSPTGHPRLALSPSEERSKRLADGNPSPSIGRPQATRSPFRERRKKLVDAISPPSTNPEEPGFSPLGEGADQRSVGEEKRGKRPAGTDPRTVVRVKHERGVFEAEEEEWSIWREYVKVTTDTGLLCLLYRNLHDGGWFLARIYD
jgi:hypothetical protein